MTKEEKLKFIKQSYALLEQLVIDINERLTAAEDGVTEDNATLIIGGLVGIDQAAEHLKNIYAAMLFVHRG